MGYFDQEKGVLEYIKMAQGYDGKALIRVLKKHLPKGSTVLELGMGPGKDLDILKKTYKATGSDASQVFVDFYKKKHPQADVMRLDARTLATKRKFDCVYSNKVLHHLPKTGCAQSFRKQRTLLKKNGLLFHSFWYGDKTELMQGLRFTYYTESSLKRVIGKGFEIVLMQKYTEMSKKNDSIFVLLRKK